MRSTLLVITGPLSINAGYIRSPSLVADVAIAERRLFQAALLQVVVDLRRPDELHARRALEFVQQGGADWFTLCRFAGVDPTRARAILLRRYWRHVQRLIDKRNATRRPVGRPRKDRNANPRP